MKMAFYRARPWAICLGAIFCVGHGTVQAANQEPENDNLPDLTSLSVEQLMNLDVTSVMKVPTDIKHVPAALFVLSSDEIRRTGATTIPEALRVVPGMHVAKVDGNKWAVSMRGFSSQFVNKLLVLVDGRSVYNPLFSGVWWDQQDVMMEDIERIEVIRGPGASLWGANAVNGVINIITKSAKDTQGGLVSSHVGTQRYGGGLRYGADLGGDSYLKVYGRHTNYSDSKTLATSGNGGDEGEMSKIGFRYDKAIDFTNKLSLQGDAYLGESDGALQHFPSLTSQQTPVLAPPYSRALPTDQLFSGHYIQGRWEQYQSADSNTVLRMYWDRHSRKSPYLDSEYQIDNIDVDFQHNYKLNDSHMFVWGSGVRFNLNNFQDSRQIAMSANNRTDRIYSLFAQDDITLVPDRWHLTLGSKLEHNPVTQFEVQPNARLLWTPDEKHSFWGSVSRSVRTPNWVEQNISYGLQTRPPIGGGAATSLNPAVMLNLTGNPDLTAEKMIGFELGWRGQISRQLSTDVALYHYSYDDYVSLTPNIQRFAGYMLQTLDYNNYGHVQVYGGEISVDWQATDDWKLRATYSHEEERFRLSPMAPANTTLISGDSYPAHKAMLWSMYQFSPQVKFDLNWRYSDATGLNGDQSRAYQDLDARLGWDLGSGVELALVGRNLLNSSHFEYGSDMFSTATAVQREVYGTLRWDF